MATELRRLLVTAMGSSPRGLLLGDGLALPCALGRSGIGRAKREGDGRTPAGLLRPVTVLFRPDRERRPGSALPVEPIAPDDGWCDDPRDPNYNRPVRLPFAGSHERLWRDDGLYDLVVVLDWNLARPRPRLGSAIFLHVARPGLAPTEGCIALPVDVLRRLVPRLGPATVLVTG